MLANAYIREESIHKGRKRPVRNEAVPVILSKEPKLRPHLWSLWLDRVEVSCNWDYSDRQDSSLSTLRLFPRLSLPGSLNSFLRHLWIGESLPPPWKDRLREISQTYRNQTYHNLHWTYMALRTDWTVQDFMTCTMYIISFALLILSLYNPWYIRY